MVAQVRDNLGGPMSGTYIISRSAQSDDYEVWVFDGAALDDAAPTPDSPPDLLAKHSAGGRFDQHNGLTAVGGYLLAYTPLDRELQQFDFRLFRFDPDKNPDPLNAQPVQAGSWDKEKFWTYYKYRNCPDEPQVTDLQLIGISGYALSFLPTTGRGTFGLWNFDAASDNPGGSQDPLIQLSDPARSRTSVSATRCSLSATT